MSSFCIRFCSCLFLSGLKLPNLSSQPRGRYQLCIFIIAKKLMWLKVSLVKWQTQDSGLLGIYRVLFKLRNSGFFCHCLFFYLPNLSCCIQSIPFPHFLSHFISFCLICFPLTDHASLNVWTVGNKGNFYMLTKNNLAPCQSK